MKNQNQQTMEQMEQIEQQNILNNFSESLKKEENKTGVLTVPSVPNPKPVWYVKEIPQAEKCECNGLNVTVELLSPTKDTIRRCTQCFEKLKRNFPNAAWQPAYPDLTNPEEAS